MGSGSRRCLRGPALFSVAGAAQAMRSRRRRGCWQGPPHPLPRGARAWRTSIPVFGSFTNIGPVLCRWRRLFNLYQFNTDAFLKCLRGARCCSALLLHGKNPMRLPIVTAFWVNAQVADIFKGIFETQKSTQNEEKNAKSGARKTCRAAVYHARIYHNAALRQTNGLLRRVRPGVHGWSECGARSVRPRPLSHGERDRVRGDFPQYDMPPVLSRMREGADAGYAYGRPLWCGLNRRIVY